MTTFNLARRGFGSRALALIAALFLAIGLASIAQPAAAAVYLGVDIGDVKPEDKAVVANPQPVQIIFEFRTKGAPNPQATKFAKEKVLAAIMTTGFFSELSEQPVANGSILNVVIDNVVDEEALRRATGQGMVTGATFFIAGSNIRENYAASVDYISGPGAAPITRTAGHYMIIQMGLINTAPKGLVKVGKMNDAFFLMASQIVTNPLNAIFKDPAITGAPVEAAPVEAAPVEAAPVEAAPMEAAPVEAAPAGAAPAEATPQS